MSRLLRGALAGAAATVPMSAVMVAGDRLLPRQPPESITRAALAAAPVDVPEGAVRPLSLAAHLGFGAALGAVTAVLPGRGPAQGVAVALAAYAASYQGWVPALGILPPASDDVPGRPAVMVAAHVVYGAVLGALLADRWPAGPASAAGPAGDR